jgi:transcriptional regulator with XRE-family HTH domain
MSSGGREVRSALEWAKVRAVAADGVSEREIARRLGMNRRTVARLARSVESPRYRRTPAESKLDPLEPVLRRLVAEWPQIKAPRRLQPLAVRPAQRTGYRPGQVLRLDWAEMPTRPTIDRRERRVYALVASLPYSGAQTAFFSFELTFEAFLEGHRARLDLPDGDDRLLHPRDRRLAARAASAPTRRSRWSNAPPAVHGIEPGELVLGSDNGSAFTARRFKARPSSESSTAAAGTATPRARPSSRAGSGN